MIIEFDIYDFLASSIKKTWRIINEQFLFCKNNQRNNIWELFTIDSIIWCCNFRIYKTFYEKNKKKYAEIMRQADNAVGRKEVVSLLKKAAIIMSKAEENLAA